MDEAVRRSGARARLVALASVGLLLGGAGAATTAAAWTDEVVFGGTAAPSTLDVQARTGSLDPASGPPDGEAGTWVPGPWFDQGLLGDPDTIDVPIVTPTVTDMHPTTSYAAPIELCDAGDVDAEITSAVITTDTTVVDLTSVNVDTIDVGSIIPADSCASGGAGTPLFG